jgi:hypothetical protein
MAGGLDGLWQVAFPFNAKVMATCPETAQSNAMFVVGNFKQVWCRNVERKVAVNVMQIIGKFGTAGTTAPLSCRG